MLPVVQGLFTLVRELAARRAVTNVATSKWLVMRHGLAPLAARAGLHQYRDELAVSALAWKRFEALIVPLIGQFGRAGIRVAPIKGVAYATTIYRTPVERPMTDIDLLIEPGSERVATKIMDALGFRQVAHSALHHAMAWIRDGIVVDIHRSIIAPGRSRIDLDALWSRMSAGWPDGAMRLDPIDAHVFHLIHLARNRLRGPLMHVIDAAWLLEAIPDKNADQTLARARGWGLGAAAELALRFCTTLLEQPRGRPVGWLGPTRQELAVFDPPNLLQKVGFDVATAGSLAQLAARVAGFGANRMTRLIQGGGR